MDSESLKYFTPSIEDIRVGYECEIWWNENMLPENNWISVKVLQEDTKDFDIYDFTSRISKNEIRTPYLTKEQIEAEGWEVTEDKSPFTGKQWKFIKSWDGPGFNEPHKLTLEWHGTASPNLAIRHEWESSWNRFNEYIYYGFCKDINTFRYICKLLGI